MEYRFKEVDMKKEIEAIDELCKDLGEKIGTESR